MRDHGLLFLTRMVEVAYRIYLLLYLIKQSVTERVYKEKRQIKASVDL